jgi:hypothetical protein
MKVMYDKAFVFIWDVVVSWRESISELCEVISRGSPEHAAFSAPAGDASGERPPEGLSWVSAPPKPTP